MPTKIVVIYDNPLDPAAFEAAHGATLTAAGAIPGILNLESSKVWPKEDGTQTPAYRLVELSFNDYSSASAAVTSEAAATYIEAVFELASGGVRIVFADVETA